MFLDDDVVRISAVNEVSNGASLNGLTRKRLSLRLRLRLRHVRVVLGESPGLVFASTHVRFVRESGGLVTDLA